MLYANIVKLFFLSMMITLLFSQREIKGANKKQFIFNDIQENSYLKSEEDLIEFIENIMNTNQIPGISASIVKNNSIVWDHYFGHANLDEEILVMENTMFSLASVSKTVTVTALMQLWEEGFFDMDDDIDQFLPFNVNHPDYPFIPITFKMLVTHTSGIKDHWNVMTYYDGDPDLELGYFLEEYLVSGGDFYGSNACFTNDAPGTQYRYSNIGAALIGYLVEVISSMPFNEYCNENIFEPLGMGNTAWFLHEVDDLEQLAIPYVLTGGSGDACFDIGCGIYDESNPCFCDSECTYYNDCCSDYDDVCGENGSGSDVNVITLTSVEHYGYADYPSGQLRSTATDLAKFMATYLNEGIFNGGSILEAETIEYIRSIPYPDIDSQQGIIWYYKDSSYGTLFGHNGGDIGSTTELFISFSDEIGVIVLSNVNSYFSIISIENALFEFAMNMDIQLSGDVNEDGILNIQDLILIVNMVLLGEYSMIADMNVDGVIDILDIVQVVFIIMNPEP